MKTLAEIAYELRRWLNANALGDVKVEMSFATPSGRNRAERCVLAELAPHFSDVVCPPRPPLNEFELCGLPFKFTSRSDRLTGSN